MKKSPKQIPKPGRRLPLLLARQRLKMARSVQTYVRGSTMKFYEWLDASGTKNMPEGPALWICGDCHVGNLGPVANAKGAVEIQIRDFDQTVIGNPIHDLIRLGLSLATAARDSELPGVTTLHMLEYLIEGYVGEFGQKVVEVARPECAQIVLRRASLNHWKHVARKNTTDLHPSIPVGKRFWPTSEPETLALATLFDDPLIASLATRLRSRPSDAEVSVLDAAYWVKGCSSLGNLRYAVLLDVDKEVRKGRDFCLMDIKEAVKALAPRSTNAGMPRDNGRRVVTGARQLSPFLGERMCAATLMDRSVFIRELLPQDLKLEINRFGRHEAMKAACYLGAVLGKAHARQMEADTRKAWHAELRRERSREFEAPSWLWNSIVELMATHEAAYLEHCRSYALRN